MNSYQATPPPPGYHQCPVCHVNQPDKKIAKRGDVESFISSGCEAVGLRHFGDRRMDRFAEGAGALAVTDFSVLDLVQDRRDQRRVRFPSGE
jgi:hypothetical protein